MLRIKKVVRVNTHSQGTIRKVVRANTQFSFNCVQAAFLDKTRCFLFRIHIYGGLVKYTLSWGLRRSTHSWGLRRFAYLVGYVDLHILGEYPMGEVRISLFLHLWCIVKEVVLVNQHISAQWGQSASLVCDCGCCC